MQCKEEKIRHKQILVCRADIEKRNEGTLSNNYKSKLRTNLLKRKTPRKKQQTYTTKCNFD